MSSTLHMEASSRPGAIRALFVCNGDAPPQPLLEGLQREAIQADIAQWTIVAESPSLSYDVVVLWIGKELPTSALSAVVKRAKCEVNGAPALMGCSANGDIEDSIAAFEAGIDTFVVGRCGGRELACRIRALHRRSGQRPERSALRCCNLSLDPHNHEAWVGRRSVQLTGTELGVLRSLLQAQGETLTRLEILDRAWGNDKGADIGVRAVDNVILRLRRKLGDSSLIETVRGIGFRLGPGNPTSETNLSA